ncbi:MAG: M50 family metallopeptidase [Candidatus Sumerlaeia bacterium]
MIMPKIIGLIGAAFLFGFAVFIHEFGHFIMAKICGVRASKFAIGFGPVIWAKKWRGTEYSLRWIPFGGFVQLKGMVEGIDEEAEEEEKASTEKKEADAKQKEKESITSDLDAMRNKPGWMRIAILASGVSMNFLSAIIFMAFILWHGTPETVDLPNRIESIPPTSQWYELGWRSGDEILAIEPNSGIGYTSSIAPESEPVRDPSAGVAGSVAANQLDSWEDVVVAMNRAFGAASQPGAEDKDIAVEAKIHRNGDTTSLPIPQKLLKNQEEAMHFQPPRPAYVGAVIPGSPAFRARLVADNYETGMEVGPLPELKELKRKPLKQDDTILAVDGEPVDSWNEMTGIVRDKANEVVTLEVQRGSKRLLLATKLEAMEDSPGKGQLGIYGGFPKTGERNRMPLWQAILLAPKRTVALTGQLITTTIDFFQESGQRQIRRNLGGPIAIGVMAYESAQRGLTEYLYLFMAISIILAVMNLLPIPVLDGGFIVIVLIESIIRRPIPQKVLVPVLTVFWVILVTLMVLISFNDIIIRFFS